jgi:hypothetical protein
MRQLGAAIFVFALALASPVHDRVAKAADTTGPTTPASPADLNCGVVFPLPDASYHGVVVKVATYTRRAKFLVATSTTGLHPVWMTPA